LINTQRKSAERKNQMKSLKLAILTATAAIAAMALGTPSASATPPWRGVCLKAELLNCKNLVKHPLLGRIISLVGPGKMNAGFVTVECEKGEGWSNLIESEANGESKTTLESLTFSGCKGCTGNTVTTPQTVTSTMETETGGWRSKTENAKVKLTGCPFGTTCIYEGNLNLEIQMSETGAFVEPKGATLKKVAGSGGLCAETSKLETGTTTFDWELDDAAFPNGTRHKVTTPSLIGEKLILVP
jgi:hypothetical protein